MDAGNQHSQVLAMVEDSVCLDPDIEFVVAFGSRVTGKSTRASDFDLAVKFVDELPSRERFETRCFLSGNVQQENTPFVDLSDVESLPVDVAHDAVHGEFVCGDERAFEQFKADIETQFEEQRDSLRHRQREVIDRIAEGGLHG